MQNNKNTLIVLVINSLAGRGGERSVLTLAKGFFDLGCCVHIVYFSDKVDYEMSKDFNFHLVCIKPYKLLPKKIRYRMFAKKVDAYILNKIGQPDLLLSNLNQPNLVMANSHLDNVALVIRNTFSEERKAETEKKRIERIRLFSDALPKKPCICVSRGVEDDLQNYLQPYLNSYQKLNTHTIYNAFDQKFMLGMAKEKPLTPIKGNYLIHVGNFSYAKDHHTLIKAYAKTNRKMPLVLVGKGKLMDEIKTLLNEYDLTENVCFMGFISNPYPLIANASGMVLSSRYEGFVRVVVEALALNVPVISTDCPSGPNEVLPAKNLTPVEDELALSMNMQKLMDNPQNFHVGYNDKFLPQNIAKEYLDYFGVDIKV